MKSSITQPRHRAFVLAAAFVPLMSAFASAQYRVDNGTARDANNRIGSGGYNDARADSVINNRVGGLAGNYLVTGNVTGGRSFRGNLGYTAPQDFRGRLGSADFDSFLRDSAGVGDLRGNYGGNTQVNPQPFFGNRTIAPPPGFVRSQTSDGTYVLPGAAPILANDGRADFGGASRSDFTQSLLGNRQQYGNAGLAPSTAMQAEGAYYGTAPLQLSEYTSLARQRHDLFSPNDGTRTGPTQSPALNNPFDVPRTPQSNDGTAPNGTSNASTPDIRSPGSTAIAGQPDASSALPLGDTGQSLSRRSSRAVDNNPQYAELQERLRQARGTRTANQPVGGLITPQPIGAGTAISTGQGAQPGTVIHQRASGTDDAVKDGTAKVEAATPVAQPANTGSKAQPAEGLNPRPSALPTPGATGSAPTPLPGAAPSADATPSDNLQLPKPEAAKPAVDPAATPMKIVSLSTGVKNAQLAKTLTQAEDLMRAGKFGSAIDAYDRAEEMASDDPLVFMGRSMAELGGGYYRNAELHLRQAFAAEPSLLYAKFDLRAMLGDDRLNFLAGDLNEIANKKAKDPGPLLLLAFIYYNGGMEDRAARALDMSQVRAGGKDLDVDALRKNWQLATPPEMNK